MTLWIVHSGDSWGLSTIESVHLTKLRARKALDKLKHESDNSVQMSKVRVPRLKKPGRTR